MKTLIGVLAGLGAGALWGLAFVAPVAVAPFTPFDLTVIRYLVFGAISLIDLASDNFRVIRSLRRQDYLLLATLGFTGNVGFYFALSMAISLAGPTVVILLLGSMPIIITLLGNRGRRRVAPRRLVLPLAIVVVGLIAVNRAAIAQLASIPALHAFLLGLALTMVAVSLWVWYGLHSARAIERQMALSSRDWTALTGVASLAILIPFIPLGLVMNLAAIPTGAFRSDMLRFLLWGAMLGGLSSWGATWAWSAATRRLPVALAAQLVVSETVFGLVYSSLYLLQWPDKSEWVGASFLIFGVLYCINAFGRGGVIGVAEGKR